MNSTNPFSPAAELTRRNLQAWDHLYGKSAGLVWGKEAVGFLRAFLAPELEGPSSFRRALDAGAGEGRNIEVLLQVAGEVVACDGSIEALDKLASLHPARVETVVSELARTPFGPAEFDFILLCDTIETLPEPEPVLRELRRIASPQARLVCNIPGPEGDVAGPGMVPAGEGGFLYEQRFFYRFMTPVQAHTLLDATGWRVLREQTMRWREDAHPGFRGYAHEHCSRVFMAEPMMPFDAGEVRGG